MLTRTDFIDFGSSDHIGHKAAELSTRASAPFSPTEHGARPFPGSPLLILSLEAAFLEDVCVFVSLAHSRSSIYI